MRISDWSSDVCSSDLGREAVDRPYHPPVEPVAVAAELAQFGKHRLADGHELECCMSPLGAPLDRLPRERGDLGAALVDLRAAVTVAIVRSEEHTSESQSLMRTSFSFFCLKQKTTIYTQL